MNIRLKYKKLLESNVCVASELCEYKRLHYSDDNVYSYP